MGRIFITPLSSMLSCSSALPAPGEPIPIRRSAAPELTMVRNNPLTPSAGAARLKAPVIWIGPV